MNRNSHDTHTKPHVAVLYGGRSPEHEISLQTAASILTHLDRAHFDVTPVGIDIHGQWFVGEEIFHHSLAQKNVSALPTQHTPVWFAPTWINAPQPAHYPQKKPYSDALPRAFDVIFPAVHGKTCEDGSLQGLLELTGLPYVGCGVLASAIGMDKDVAKRLVQAMNIAVPPYVVVKHHAWLAQPHLIAQNIHAQLHLPYFVKPARSGSSIGITKITQHHQLAGAINHALQFDTKILIEEAIPHTLELEVAVLESLHAADYPIVSVVGEIQPSHDFYSYTAKYLDTQGAELIIPASCSPEITQAVQTMARDIFLKLECEGMARIDLLVNRETSEIYFNEINTLPGFTAISMYPKLMIASGLQYSDLLTHLIQLAIYRHQHHIPLQHQPYYLTVDHGLSS